MVSEAVDGFSPPKTKFSAVVVGGSAGALSSLEAILTGLWVEVPIVVVLHLAAQGTSAVAELFAGGCRMPITEVVDKAPVVRGTVYFAPPDYHLLIEDDERFALSVGPRVKHCRPAVDMLFESASECFGPRLLAIVLSGANDDGADGAVSVQRRGGLVVVQDPATCEAPQMPRAVLQRLKPDLTAPPESIRDWLVRYSTSRHET